MLFVDTSEGPVSLVMVTGSNRGQDFGLFTQHYMITKKLTFDILFKSTRKIFPNYVLGTKTVSDIQNSINIVSFDAICQKLGPKIYLHTQIHSFFFLRTSKIDLRLRCS